jgi:hypothetical protein
MADRGQHNPSVNETKGFPPWAWIGCGCLGAVAGILFFTMAAGFWAVRKARDFGKEIADPETREERVLAVLGAEKLPGGYHPVIAFSVPYLLEVAVLSDRAPDESGKPPELGDHAFFYFSYPTLGQDQEPVRDFFGGRRDNLDQLGPHRIDLVLRERIATGSIARGRNDVLWVAHRGVLHSDDTGDSKDGLLSLFLFDCGDSRNRFAMWLGPDPDPDTPVAELDRSGTVADPGEIGAFPLPDRALPLKPRRIDIQFLR